MFEMTQIDGHVLTYFGSCLDDLLINVCYNRNRAMDVHNATFLTLALNNVPSALA